MGGLAGVPKGISVWPIKRHCKIKDTEEYKVRWVVLGNLDDYSGDTYAPTAGKREVWLVFALAILLGLCRRFFETDERGLRVIEWEDLHGAVHDGLREHVESGGYTQSVWDRCLFYKWVSILSFIYLLFHMDDFKAAATSEALIDEFHQQHLASKYTSPPTTTECI